MGNASPCILFFDELDAIARARGGSSGDAGGAGDRVMNQLLTEMDGINPTKQVFFVGATNRPDIIDPAIKRPGRLDQMIFIDLPDFPSRVSILKATLRKSPVDPSTDFEYLAEQTHGYSGADLHGISKVAAKLAIRSTIAKQVERLKKIESGELDPDDAAAQEEEDEVPMITMDMMRRALKESKRSVSPAEYQKYLSMKVQFDREAGIIDNGQNNAPQSQPQAINQQLPPSSSQQSAQQPNLLDDDDDSDIYDIYD